MANVKIFDKGRAVLLPANTFTFDADDTEQYNTIKLGQQKIGILTHLEVIIPATTNNVTVTVTVKSPRGGALSTDAALADDSTHVLTPDVPIEADSTIYVTLSGVTGDAGDKVITVAGYIANLY